MNNLKDAVDVCVILTRYLQNYISNYQLIL
jgi:hypothetical protein